MLSWRSRNRRAQTSRQMKNLERKCLTAASILVLTFIVFIFLGRPSLTLTVIGPTFKDTNGAIQTTIALTNLSKAKYVLLNYNVDGRDSPQGSAERLTEGGAFGFELSPSTNRNLAFAFNGNGRNSFRLVLSGHSTAGSRETRLLTLISSNFPTLGEKLLRWRNVTVATGWFQLTPTNAPVSTNGSDDRKDSDLTRATERNTD